MTSPSSTATRCIGAASTILSENGVTARAFAIGQRDRKEGQDHETTMETSDCLCAGAGAVLSAAACGKSDDTAGDDWRASGAVVDSGTITHDGDSVDVLVTVSESSAAFYRDMPEQVLFDSVSFPVSIPDAEEAFHAISF